MKAREKITSIFTKELFDTLNIARKKVAVWWKITNASPSLSNLIYDWQHRGS